MNRGLTLAAAAAALIAASGAGAVTFYNNTTPTGQLATPGSTSYTFAGPTAMGSLSFELAGYRTLDGANCCTDTVTVDLNGTTILQAAYNLGGGGNNTVFVGSPTVTFYSSGSPAAYNGTALGGLIDITLAATFAASNTLTFTYSGAAQGTADEAWGINSVSASAGVVPEPASWALMIGGLGLVGAAARRRRTTVAA